MDTLLAKEPTITALLKSTRAHAAVIFQEDRDAVRPLQLGLLTENNAYNAEGAFDIALNTYLWEERTPYKRLEPRQKLEAIFSKPTHRLKKFRECLVDLGWHSQQSQIEHLEKLRNDLGQILQPIYSQPDGFHVTNTNLTSDQARALSSIGKLADLSIIVDV